MLAILGFITSPLGKIATYVVGALVGAGMLTGLYVLWKHQVEQAALAKYNAAQLEQALRDTQDQLKKTEAIFTLQQQSITDLVRQREELDARLSSIDDFIAHAKDDRPSSDVIKGTLERLGAPK